MLDQTAAIMAVGFCVPHHAVGRAVAPMALRALGSACVRAGMMGMVARLRGARHMSSAAIDGEGKAVSWFSESDCVPSIGQMTPGMLPLPRHRFSLSCRPSLLLAHSCAFEHHFALAHCPFLLAPFTAPSHTCISSTVPPPGRPEVTRPKHLLPHFSSLTRCRTCDRHSPLSLILSPTAPHPSVHTHLLLCSVNDSLAPACETRGRAYKNSPSATLVTCP